LREFSGLNDRKRGGKRPLKTKRQARAYEKKIGIK